MAVQEYELPRSGIAYRPRDKMLRLPRIFVSETEFSREILQLANGASGSRTATFPRTIREVRDCAFAENEHMASVVLNEGLEVLGEYSDKENLRCDGAFRNAKVRQVMFPSTLKVLREYAFCGC